MKKTDAQSGFNPSRRQFWGQLLGLAAESYDEFRGIEHKSLINLDELPAEEIAVMIPVFRDELDLYVEGGNLYQPDQKGDSPQCVYQAESVEVDILLRFSTGMTIQEIAEELSKNHALNSYTALERVCGLFFHLVRDNYCHPA